jgi:uncharacterized protein
VAILDQSQIKGRKLTGITNSQETHRLRFTVDTDVYGLMLSVIALAGYRRLEYFMFLIRTRVGPSPIHGNGVFACEDADRGVLIWKFEPLFDREVSEADLVNMPVAFREYIDMYAYRATQLDGRLILSCDHAKFLNHSHDPNTSEIPLASIARRKIYAGDEITCDYGAFCTDWTGFDESPRASLDQSQVCKQPPHHTLYTRIRQSKDGIGVFAIRDIPQGMRLFVGDTGKTVAVPRQTVEELADDEIRRMYIDLCPVSDGYFIAPSDFNQITMSWYLNHSSNPNVTVLEDLSLVASKFIAKGVELRTDYTTFSEHAASYVRDWE